MNARTGIPPLATSLLILLALGCARASRLEIQPEVTLIPPSVKNVDLEPSGKLDTRQKGHTIQITITGERGLQASFNLAPTGTSEWIESLSEKAHSTAGAVREDDPKFHEVLGALAELPEREVEDIDLESSASFPVDHRIEKEAQKIKGYLVETVPMQERSPGVYVGTFEVSPGELGSLDIIGHVLNPGTGAAREFRFTRGIELYVSELTAGCNAATLEQFERLLEDVTIYFEFDKHDITPTGRAILAESLTILKDYPACKVVLHGHADEVGSEEYNLLLSKKRAEEVAHFLNDYLGVSRDRLTIAFHGEFDPVVRSGTGEGHARNRRVELHVH